MQIAIKTFCFGRWLGHTGAAGYAPALQGTRRRCRVGTGPLEPQGTHRCAWDAGYTPARPRGGVPACLPAVSRFLNFPIMNRAKSFRTWTSNPTPRASLCSRPGGYVREAGKPPTGGLQQGTPSLRGPEAWGCSGSPPGRAPGSLLGGDVRLRLGTSPGPGVGVRGPCGVGAAAFPASWP